MIPNVEEVLRSRRALVRLLSLPISQINMPAHDFIQLNPSVFALDDSNYFSPSYWEKKRAVIGQETGRGTTWFIRFQEHELVLRHYYRGGLIGRFNRDAYLFTTMNKLRSFKEYRILAALFARGLPVPEPIGAYAKREGLFYRADLITRRIPNARDLINVLQQAPSEGLLKNIAALVAKLHQAGVDHPDLNIKNLLLDASDKLWVIDFDQAKITTLSSAKREAMLMRLKRSFEKEATRNGIFWSETYWNQLYAAYQNYVRQ